LLFRNIFRNLKHILHLQQRKNACKNEKKRNNRKTKQQFGFNFEVFKHKKKVFFLLIINAQK